MEIANTEGLICEALVREMRDAKSWQSVTEAWEALLHVRHMAKQLMLEENLHRNSHISSAEEG